MEQSFVAARDDIVLNAFGVDLSRVLEDYALLIGEKREVGIQSEPFDRLSFQGVDNIRGVVLRIVFLNVLVEASLRFDGDERPGGAKTHAANALHLASVTKAAFLHVSLKFALHLITVLRETGGSGADMNAVLEL
jgi:hypothetical protein